MRDRTTTSDRGSVRRASGIFLLVLLLAASPAVGAGVVSRCLVTGETVALSERCCLVDEAFC